VTDYPLSYSQVSTLRTCGEQYRLRYIEKAPKRPSCAAVGGTIIHSVCDVIDRQLLAGVRDPSALEREALRSGADELADEVGRLMLKPGPYSDPATWQSYGRKTNEWPGAQNMVWYDQVGIPAAIGNYIDWRLDNLDLVPLEIPGFGPAIEVPFDVYLDGMQIRGFIDRIFVSASTGGHALLDLKSGLKPKTDEQLGLYRLAADLLPGNFQWGYYLYGLKYSDKPAILSQPIDLSHWTKDKLLSVYAPAAKTIAAKLFMPSPGEACMHCSVSASCDFAVSAL